MPFYEFECEKCSHVTESFEQIGTKRVPCEKCSPSAKPADTVWAKLILSPTRTTFVFAGGRKD